MSNAAATADTNEPRVSDAATLLRQKLQPLVCASILAADCANLQSEVHRLLQNGVDVLHVDVMDGHFVPNISFGPATVKSLRKRFPEVFFDCHLMVEQPSKWIVPYVQAGASSVTFHIEAERGNDDQLHALVRQVKEMGVFCGIAVSPDTPIEAAFAFAAAVDFVLVMTVRPGFGGQTLMSEALEKIKVLRQKFPSLSIQADGGITCENVAAVAAAGANLIVAGSAITASIDQKSTVQCMKAHLRNAFSSK